jgi:ABC-type multidrug transport system fused ATPase/permease subunit
MAVASSAFRRTDAAQLRRQVGVVLQENFLFNRSVRENIAIADPAAPLEAVMRAAQLAGAHEFQDRSSQIDRVPVFSNSAETVGKLARAVRDTPLLGKEFHMYIGLMLLIVLACWGIQI